MSSSSHKNESNQCQVLSSEKKASFKVKQFKCDEEIKSQDDPDPKANTTLIMVDKRIS